jgi:hypothetical protein
VYDDEESQNRLPKKMLIESAENIFDVEAHKENVLRNTIERQTMPKVAFGGCKESQVETSVDLKDQKRKEGQQASRICRIVMFVR